MQNTDEIVNDYKKKNLTDLKQKLHRIKRETLEKNIEKKKKILNFQNKKYRISIIEAMQEEKIKKYGFEKSYIIFERSVNKLAKSGDEAEKMAIKYLKHKNLLSSNYSTNRVIALGRIKIEADIIDYTNKIIYETKSRRTGKLAKQAVIKKWKVFEYDKKNSIYQDFEFKGIVVANYDTGKQVKGIVAFKNRILDEAKTKEHFEKYFKRLKELKKIKRNINNEK